MAKTNGSIARGSWNIYTPINAVTATTTSSSIPVAGAKRITCEFTRADHSSGSTAFTVEFSFDDSTWTQHNMLVQNLARDAGVGTAGQDIGTTAASSVTLSSDTTELWSVDLEHFVAPYMRVVATETTDGTHTAKVMVEY